MGLGKLLASLLGPSRPQRESASDRRAILDAAQRYVDVIAASARLVQESNEAATKIARLRVADDNLRMLAELNRDWPFLGLDAYLMQASLTLDQLRLKGQVDDWARIAAENEKAMQLEKAGAIDDALAVYERLAASGTDTPHTYRRLAILYAKRKRWDDELRAIELALTNLPPERREWFSSRLLKLAAKPRKPPP